MNNNDNNVALAHLPTPTTPVGQGVRSRVAGDFALAGAFPTTYTPHPKIRKCDKKSARPVHHPFLYPKSTANKKLGRWDLGAERKNRK